MRNFTVMAALLLSVLPLAASAADGTITFNGKVTSKTCTVSTPAGKNFTVTLPTVSTTSLAAAGAVAGSTPFSISLTGCAAGNVAAYFEPGATVDFNSGRLLNQAQSNAAGNVQIQLLGSNNGFLPVLAAGSNQTQTNSQSVKVASDGSANLNYYAEYYATAAATAGDVTTSVQYTLIYN